jgi:hypothetical protein
VANRFWVGGTGTWDAATTTHWASSSGGAGGQTVPGSADTVTFDASSGGGTVTVNTTVNVTSITMGAFTGTLDFSANNNNVTLQTFSLTGSGVRTLNMGDGTWTVTSTGSMWNALTTTNLTFNANSSVLTFTATSASTRSFSPAGLTYHTVNVSANSSGGLFSFNGGTPTIATFNVTGPNCITFFGGVTVTITTLSVSGGSGSEVALLSTAPGTAATVSVASNAPTLSWAGIRDLTCTGGATFTATDSFDLGHNTGITINPPGGAGTTISTGGVIGS